MSKCEAIWNGRSVFVQHEIHFVTLSWTIESSIPKPILSHSICFIFLFVFNTRNGTHQWMIVIFHANREDWKGLERMLNFFFRADGRFSMKLIMKQRVSPLVWLGYHRLLKR